MLMLGKRERGRERERELCFGSTYVGVMDVKLST